MRCANCNGFGVLFDLLCGYVNCPTCAPKKSVCVVCGMQTEPFELNMHADCQEYFDRTGKAYYIKGVKTC